MINKDEAEKKNIKIIDREDKKSEDRNDIIAKLKEILPNVITSDDALNIDALKDVIDIANTTANNKGYELTFAGKGLAKALADIPTDTALKIEEAQSKDFKNTDNVVIRGDNIEVLKLLKQNYYGKIKMIYIDPPYNTKNEDFLYKDNFNIRDEKELVEEFGIGEDTVNFLSNIYGTRSHSGWLSFMYPRLKLARDLLTDDGVIFISIDDHEQANLKIICDEIFGENNLIGQFLWRKKAGAGADSKLFFRQHEYLLCYAKNSSIIPALFQPLNEKQIQEYSNPDDDPRGKWAPTDLTAPAHDNDPKRIYMVTSPTGKTFEKCWSYTYDNFVQLEKDNLIWWGKNRNSVPKRKRFYHDKKGLTPRSWIDDILTKDGKSDLQTINFDYFPYPKPVKLIKRIIEIGLSNEFILDFFAGSGTTGDAVMQLNAEDGGNRKFILVQCDEKIKDEKEFKTAYDFCIENKLEPVISSITIERLNRAGEKITTDKPELKDTLDIGYKVFSLADKRKFDDNEYGKLVLETYNFSTFDKLYQMMNSSNKPLHLKIEEIEKDKLYKVDNEFYILDTFKTSIEDLQGHQIYLDAYSTISLEDALNLGIIDNENLTIIY